MQVKRSVLLVIDSLEAGGAETMFIDVIPQLAEEFELHLVTCNNRNDFGDDIYAYFKTISNLEHKGYRRAKSYLYLRSSVNSLKSIIERIHPDLVHAQLFLSTIIARFACPRNTPLVYTVHFTMDVFY